MKDYEQLSFADRIIQTTPHYVHQILNPTVIKEIKTCWLPNHPTVADFYHYGLGFNYYLTVILNGLNKGIYQINRTYEQQHPSFKCDLNQLSKQLANIQTHTLNLLNTLKSLNKLRALTPNISERLNEELKIIFEQLDALRLTTDLFLNDDLKQTLFAFEEMMYYLNRCNATDDDFKFHTNLYPIGFFVPNVNNRRCIDSRLVALGLNPDLNIVECVDNKIEQKLIADLTPAWIKQVQKQK